MFNSPAQFFPADCKSALFCHPTGSRLDCSTLSEQSRLIRSLPSKS